MDKMDDDLIQISQAGEIDKLYERLAVLKQIDNFMFEDTPLHVAASSGQTCFAMEVMNLMPSFARKLNKDGLSPMHLALSKGHSELVLLLLRADQELVRVKGRGGITPLHYVTQTGNIHLLAIFLAACPRSIEDMTVQGESVLHIAVKNNKIEALKVLVGWLQRVCHEDAFGWNTDIPNWRDKNGDTVLDIAVSNKQIEAIQLLAEINARNSKVTALGTLQTRTKMGRRVRQMLRYARVSEAPLPKKTSITLANYLRSNTKYYEKIAVYVRRLRMQIPVDVRSALLVVAGVIIAASFHAVFSPPGGVGQVNHHHHHHHHESLYPNDQVNNNTIILINGTSIITTVSNTAANGGSPSNDTGKSVMHTGDFVMFSGTNTLVLCTVILIIGLLLPDGLLGLFLILLLIYLLLCYSVSISVISPNKHITKFYKSSLSLFSLILLPIIIFYTLGSIKIRKIWYSPNKSPKEAVAEEVEGSGAMTTSGESGARGTKYYIRMMPCGS